MRSLLIVLLFGVGLSPAFAQTGIGEVDADLCLALEDDPEETLSAVGADTSDEMVSQLVVTAVLRQCAAAGFIAPPEFPEVEDTRTFEETPEIALSPEEVMSSEAALYLDVAMGVDADAANDLLRRLLGPPPDTGGASE